MERHVRQFGVGPRHVTVHAVVVRALLFTDNWIHLAGFLLVALQALLVLVDGGCLWMPEIDYRETTSEMFEINLNLSDTDRALPHIGYASVFTNCVSTLKRSATVLFTLKR